MNINRCERCKFPLAESIEKGCVVGNCSYRPQTGSNEYYLVKEYDRVTALKNKYENNPGAEPHPHPGTKY